MEKIEWRRIIMNSRESNYQISSTGLIMNNSGLIMKPFELNSGYLTIKLSMNDCKYAFLVHRLVAEYFIPNPNNLPEVNHKDGNKKNNDVSNLEWVTKCENMQHAANNNLLNPKIGIENPFCIHTEDQIKEACKLLESGKYTQAEVINITGVKRHTIEGIIKGTKWKYISSNYNVGNYKKSNMNPRWEQSIISDILNAYSNGYNSTRKILLVLGIPDTNPNIQRVQKLLRKATTSTTIPVRDS